MCVSKYIYHTYLLTNFWYWVITSTAPTIWEPKSQKYIFLNLLYTSGFYLLSLIISDIKVPVYDYFCNILGSMYWQINSHNDWEIILFFIHYFQFFGYNFGKPTAKNVLYIWTKLLKSSKKRKIFLLEIYLPVEMK